MSTTIPYKTDRSYQLEGAFPEKQQPATWPLPLTSDEQDLLLQKLGSRAWGRMLHFTKFYGPGWGEGQNKQLSPKGQAAFLLYLQNASFRAQADPSVFLTDLGELELVWEDVEGRSIQLTFGSKGVELYQETAAGELELQVSHREAPAIAQRLSGL